MSYNKLSLPYCALVASCIDVFREVSDGSWRQYRGRRLAKLQGMG